MRHLFVDYEIALELKKFGFNEPCFAKFNKESFQLNTLGFGTNYNDGYYGVKLISAPTYQQVVDWLEIKNLFLETSRNNLDNSWSVSLADENEMRLHYQFNSTYKTKKEGLDSIIKEAVKILNKK